MADKIEGSVLVELPGVDHIPFVGGGDAIVDEVEEFVTVARSAPGAD